MRQVLNQFRRMFTDDGRNDRDFSDQEKKLAQAVAHLNRATDELKRASEIISALSRRILG